MLTRLVRRAEGKGPDALAALVLVHALAGRVAPGVAERKLEAIADKGGPYASEARLLALSLEPVVSRASPDDLVTSLSVLGPFQDTSGRIREADLREEDPAAWAARDATYSWGVYDVRWRPVVTPTTARGVPLDLYLFPRRETCAYLASRVTLDKPTTLRVSLAGSGAVRLLWDGVTLDVSDETHALALLDRLSARVEAKAGDHLVAARICAGSLDDVGRARLRLSTDAGEPLRAPSSKDLGPLAGVAFAPFKHEALKTPLARSLALGKRPTPAESLASIVLRTRGGADDLRSPRAPGLTEELSKRATPDVLALLGWISPFGAVRSGLLSRAREVAEASGQKAVEEFAERRIVAARADAGLFEWAKATLSVPPLSTATDTESRLLRAYVEGELLGEAARRRELAGLVALADEKKKLPVEGWELVARMAEPFDRTIALRARDELAKHAPERFDLDRVRAAALVDADTLVRVAGEAIRSGSLTDPDDLAAAAEELLRSGRPRDALTVLSLGELVAPNVVRIQELLSRALFASGRPEDAEKGRAHLMRARELAPANATLRAEASFRDRGGAGKERRDERFLVPSEAILARVTAQPAKLGEVVDRQPYWLRAVTQDADRRVSQLIQYAREIVIPPRTQEELYEPVPTEGDDTEILRARVHRKDGSVAFAEEQSSEHGRPLIRWPKLGQGDVVEVVVRSSTRGPIGRRGDPPFYFMDYGGSVSTHPLLYNEVVTDLPKDGPLAVDVLHGKPDRVETKEEGDRVVTRYVWDHPVTIEDEPLMPRPTEILPTLVASSFATWGEFRAWYDGAVKGFTEPDAQIEELAKKLTQGKTTRDEKLRALFEFVADDIRYVNFVSGEWWLPNRPQELLARRQGDCDDKAILLISLLRAVGIEATEVLIQTRLTAQPSLLLSKKVAVPLFDHGIAYLPAKDGRPAVWLDATSPESRLGPVPSMDARTFALFASEGPAEMVPTPRGSPEDYGSDARWTIELSATGEAELTAEETHRGDHAFFLRTGLREEASRAQWVDEYLVGATFPQAEIDPKIAFEAALPDGRARVAYRAKSRAFGRNEGDDLLVTLSPSSTWSSSLAALPTRTTPVVLPSQLAPSKLTKEVRFVAPPGMVPGDLPPGGEARGGAFGHARLEILRDAKDARVVVLRSELVFDREVIPVAEYPAFRGWLLEVDSLLHRSARFVRGGTPR